MCVFLIIWGKVVKNESTAPIDETQVCVSEVSEPPNGSVLKIVPSLAKNAILSLVTQRLDNHFFEFDF